MAVYKCKMCGASLDVNEKLTFVECDSCGSKQTLPKLDDERRNNLYDRANHFRRNNEFDKAISIYEQILNEDKEDAESYWSLVLCKYGITYVEDPKTYKRVPTVNRAQFTSIYDDENYKQALKYADGYQKDIYQEEANAINEIQKNILAISKNEKPFDVFICYKETDSYGKRTRDSVLANELYHQLTQEGFKVFFSRITLEDKLGIAYEPYIFAALNSSKVMVVIGTKEEYFKAVWVKNEWSRYLNLMKSNSKKVLIPAYKDMDPYDLPEEFSHLQAQDMSKLGFMQDLIRGIKKVINYQKEEKVTIINQENISYNKDVNNLINRTFDFLEDRDFISADEYCEKVLDIDSQCAKAYLAKILIENNASSLEDLSLKRSRFDNTNNYEKYIKYAGESEIEKIKNISEKVYENIYLYACDAMEKATTIDVLQNIINIFYEIKEYKNVNDKINECNEKNIVLFTNMIYSGFNNKIEENPQEFLTNNLKELNDTIDDIYNDCVKSERTSVLYNKAKQVIKILECNANVKIAVANYYYYNNEATSIKSNSIIWLIFLIALIIATIWAFAFKIIFLGIISFAFAAFCFLGIISCFSVSKDNSIKSEIEKNKAEKLKNNIKELENKIKNYDFQLKCLEIEGK